PINLAFPVVSADSDHRLLSWQPFGLLRWVLLIVAVESGARRPCTTSWKTYEFPAHTRVASQTDGFGRDPRLLCRLHAALVDASVTHVAGDGRDGQWSARHVHDPAGLVHLWHARNIAVGTGFRCRSLPHSGDL